MSPRAPWCGPSTTSATGRGAPRWWPHATIATEAGAGEAPFTGAGMSAHPSPAERRRWMTAAWAAPVAAAVLAMSLPVAADNHAVKRLVAAMAPYLRVPGHDEADLRRACGDDVLCAARRIVAAGAAAGPAAIRLVRTSPPDTDVIRWARTRPSVTDVSRLGDGRGAIALAGFGRTVETEFRAALDSLSGEDGTGDGRRDLVIDLRSNGGGDFERMLRIAGLLLGPVPAALTLHRGEVRTVRDLPSVALVPVRGSRLSVLVGPATASSAEVLAALLKRYGAARVLGARTAGKDWLNRVVPVMQGWRLLIPAERIEVPGTVLAGGLVPDGPIPPRLRSALMARVAQKKGTIP
ncbi:MAG: hypothetical protein D6826_09985 [Alphaproteobacteria bacterium]|nr:MAG: hypothetical protein D6826_09985 [Alphaproteobacteria bacterium]